MRPEEDVPIIERYLSVEGHLSAQTRESLQKGLPEQLSVNTRICFMSFSYADLSLPKEFDVLFRYNYDETIVRRGEQITSVFQPKHLATATFTRIKIVAVTQQFAIAWQDVSHGWKTVCVLEFPDGVPPLIDELPTVDGWYQSREAVALCSHGTLQAIQQSCMAT